MFNSNFPDRVAPRGREPNLPGDRYGRLVLESEVEDRSTGFRWAVRCDCGVEKRVLLAELRRGRTMSCGCLQSEARAEACTTHGLYKHPLRATHNGMMQRCYKHEEPAFSNYGGRGIRVCERWHDIRNFVEDMYPTYSPGLTLERVDNNLGYAPDNCVWATKLQQGRNKRNNRLVSYLGKLICLAEACEIAGLPYSRVGMRLTEYGWSIPRALESENFSDPVLESAEHPEPLCLNP